MAANCQTIPTPEITTILKTECIGNSLPTINNNFTNLQTGICGVDNNLNLTDITLTNIKQFTDTITTSQLAKAWVQFSGRRRETQPGDTFIGRQDFTNANRFIRNKFNVVNILRNAVGDYTVVFENSFGTDYAFSSFVSMAPINAQSPNLDQHCVIAYYPITPITQNSARFVVVNLQGASVDPEYISLIFYGSDI